MNSKEMISIVAAVDRNLGLGKKVNGEDKLLFRFKEDMDHVYDVSKGHSVIMGKTTYLSIPEKRRPLPDRTNIVLTRDTNLQIPGVEIAHSLDEALEKAKHFPGSEEIIIFGGAHVYKEAIDRDLVDVLHMTEIDDVDPQADAHFPQYQEKFPIVLSEFRGVSKDGIKFRFRDLAREEFAKAA